jgi:hypothetical protein
MTQKRANARQMQNKNTKTIEFGDCLVKKYFKDESLTLNSDTSPPV